MPNPRTSLNGLIFACMAASGDAELEALILASSIRTFAEEFSESPVWVLIPENESDISDATREKLISLKVRLVPFKISQDISEFPLAGKVFASATAESLASGRRELLVWMDSDSIIISNPKELLLRDGKNLGCRPVDHTLIGSSYDEPKDAFWESIYRNCSVRDDDLFPMTATVDENRIRPYFNAGFLVVRPERGLLRLWCDNFIRLYRRPCFEETYRKSHLHFIFFHQAILAGSILSSLVREEIQVLSHRINYPLQMHAAYPADHRPEHVNDLVTCRYDVLFKDPNWKRTISIKDPLKSWLEQLGIS